MHSAGTMNPVREQDKTRVLTNSSLKQLTTMKVRSHSISDISTHYETPLLHRKYGLLWSVRTNVQTAALRHQLRQQVGK